MLRGGAAPLSTSELLWQQQERSMGRTLPGDSSPWGL